MRRPWRSIVCTLLSICVVAGCDETRSTSPDEEPGAEVSLTVQANLAAVTVAGMVVTVTGPAIQTPIVANLEIVNSRATGTVLVPAGARRTFVLQAFDSEGVETHRGTATLNVSGAGNQTLDMVLLPLTGSVPIDARLGTYTVSLSAGSIALRVGQQVSLGAHVVGVNGGSLGGVEVEFATSNPGLVQVTRGSPLVGVVRGLRPGAATVSANYEGFAAAANVAVIPRAAIAVGWSHSCGITPDNTAFCWGENGFPLGTGSSSEPAPAPVLGDHEFTAISLGIWHTCALDEDGTVWCWGRGSSGRLGNGEAMDRDVPVAVSGGHVFATITSGGDFNCGLTTTRKVYCWGWNRYGQLGSGSTDDNSLVPVPVAGSMEFRAVSAGHQHACGATAQGGVVCWGRAESDGQAFRLGATPTETCGPENAPCSRSPLVVPVPAIATTVSAGRHHTCTLSPAGQAYCWGSNASGQLGDGTTTSRANPAPVVNGAALRQITAGERHTCALTIAGEARCWGVNSGGALGNAANALTATPVFAGMKWEHLATGSVHTCGLGSLGEAYCVGTNTNGQLGTGTPETTFVPRRVFGNLIFASAFPFGIGAANEKVGD